MRTSIAPAIDAREPNHATTCRNCGAPAPSRFCPECGQSTTLHPPTVAEFAHEFVMHSIALEGALARTLSALLLVPGRLTTEYFAGRRARYIAPLRLYLTTSLLFFAIAGVGGIRFANQDWRVTTDVPSDATVVVAPIRSDLHTGIGVFDRALARVKAMPDSERTTRLQSGVRTWLPSVLIVLVPVLALCLWVAYRSRRRLYGEHLVVAVHAQAVAFVFGLVSAIPLGDAFGLAVAALFMAHGAIALRRVYGGRWWTTIVRETLVMTVYLACVAFAVSVLATLSLFLP